MVLSPTMSAFTNTTYTSAAPSSPPTSLSDASAPCASPEFRPNIMRPLRVAPVKPQDPSDCDFQFVVKGASLLCGVLVAFWLLGSAIDDALALYIVAYILSLVYGGTRTLGDSSVSAQTITKHVQGFDASTSEKVVPWLAELAAISPTSPEPTAIQCVLNSSRFLDVEPLTVLEPNYKDKRQDITVSEIDLTFLDLAGLVELFNEEEDHHDILSWMIKLATLAEQEPHNIRIEPTNSMVRIDPYNPVDEAFAKLAQLMEQHGNPTFNDGDLWSAVDALHQVNHDNVYRDDGSSVPMDFPASMPGRSVIGDAEDINFMYNTLLSRLSQEVIAHFAQQHPDVWYRSRCWQSGSNSCREALILLWHMVTATPDAIKNVDDVLAIDEARVKRLTPACPEDERHLCGPDSWHRPYLNYEEEKAVNRGIAEYNQYGTWYPELSELLQQLQASPNHIKLAVHNPVPKWLYDMNEEEMLDPNAFDPCCCGEAAAESITAYRNEIEVNYDPAKSYFSHFPLTYAHHHVITDRWLCKLEGKEVTSDHRIPRCKKIKQVCDLHELVSNNIFVLVDTSVDDINDRLVDPRGPLPVPGFTRQAQYPPDFETLPRFLEVAYQDLAPRCEHGLLHPPWAGACELCFEPRKHVNCAECVHNDAVQFERAPVFHTVPQGVPCIQPVATYFPAANHHRPAPACLQPLPQGSRPKFWFET